MLYPQANNKRNIISLDGLWHFAKDEHSVMENKGWTLGIPHMREVAVPASWNEQHQDLMDFFETGWYEKEFEVSNVFKNNRMHLRIGAANYFTKVWLNGKFLGEHEGAHLPFEFDITEELNFEGTNRLVISVDARIDPDRLPPGDLGDEMIIGFKGQFPGNYYDFFPYGGINRSVLIYTTDKIYIEHIQIDTEIKYSEDEPLIVADKGVIKWQVFLNEPTSGHLNIGIGGKNFEYDVHYEQHLSGMIDIEKPELWCQESPNLYAMSFELFDDTGRIDKYVKKVGIREVVIEGHQLLLNRKPVFLRGVGMHEDFPVLGKGVNEAVIVKDFNMLKWLGANSIRTSHYPYSEEFLNYADEHGLLVIGETPFVGFVRRHYTNPAIIDRAKKVIDEMITRDRNHPSIIIWSLANEGDTFVEEADAFYKTLYQHTKEMDNTRPLTIVNCLTIEKDCALKHFDVICINRYRGWYEQSGRLDAGCEELNRNLDDCFKKYKRPIMVTEFGADAVAGLHMDPPHQFSEEYQSDMVTRQYQIIRSKPFMLGAHIWVYADFKTSQTSARVGYNHKGLFSRTRQPKLAAHNIKRIWAEEDNNNA